MAGKKKSKPVAAEVTPSAVPAPLSLCCCCADPSDDQELLRAAARLAVDLDLPLFAKAPASGFEMHLVAAPGRLELRVVDGPDEEIVGGRPVFADLSLIDVSSNAGRSLKQPIAKALGIKKRSDPAPTVIDATAGWGEDAWVMAALGCKVLCVERSKIVATLLRDALLRAGIGDMAMLGRVSVVTADSKHLLRRLSRLHEEPASDLPAEMRAFLEPDVVYLDPMFPGSDTRKGAERKPMRVLRRLVGEDGDAAELFAWALRVARKRVVVKRPIKAPPLQVPAGFAPVATEPDIVFEGKGYRFDVIVTGK